MDKNSHAIGQCILSFHEEHIYRAGSNRYKQLCGAEAYPATERTLSLFVASLYKDGLAGSTAKNVSRWRTLLTDRNGADMGSMPRLDAG